MIKIELESSVRNYLIRLLEQRKTYLNNNNINQMQREYELTQISLANANLMGKKPRVNLGKNISVINFGLGEED